MWPIKLISDYQPIIGASLHVSMLAINIKHALVDDPVIQVRRKTIVDGWPEYKDKLTDCLRVSMISELNSQYKTTLC